MKAVIFNRPEMDGYELCLYVEGPHYRIPAFFVDNRIIIDENNTIRDGEVCPSSLFLDKESYEAIRSALIGEAIERDDALADTRKVRDRLLTLIESGWKAQVG